MGVLRKSSNKILKQRFGKVSQAQPGVMHGGTSTTLTLLVASASAMSWKAVNGKGCGMGYIHMDDPVTHGATPPMTLSQCAAAVQAYNGQNGCIADYFFFENAGYCNCPLYDEMTGPHFCDGPENNYAGSPGQLYKFTGGAPAPPGTIITEYTYDGGTCDGSAAKFALNFTDGVCKEVSSDYAAAWGMDSEWQYMGLKIVGSMVKYIWTKELSTCNSAILTMVDGMHEGNTDIAWGDYVNTALADNCLGAHYTFSASTGEAWCTLSGCRAKVTISSPPPPPVHLSSSGVCNGVAQGASNMQYDAVFKTANGKWAYKSATVDPAANQYCYLYYDGAYTKCGGSEAGWLVGCSGEAPRATGSPTDLMSTCNIWVGPLVDSGANHLAFPPSGTYETTWIWCGGLGGVAQGLHNKEVNFWHGATSSSGVPIARLNAGSTPGISYNAAVAACAGAVPGATLCSRTELCPYGVRPYDGGIAASGSMWVPLSDSVDQWHQLGQGEAQMCATHLEMNSNPPDPHPCGNSGEAGSGDASSYLSPDAASCSNSNLFCCLPCDKIPQGCYETCMPYAFCSSSAVQSQSWGQLSECASSPDFCNGCTALAASCGIYNLGSGQVLPLPLITP